MEKIILIVVAYIFILGQISCRKTETEKVSFKNQDKYSMYSYMEAHKDTFSSFLSIAEKGGISEILSSYNTTKNSSGYTLFLPDNNAVDKFIRESGRYASLTDLLNDTEYVNELCRFHVLSTGYLTDEFPYGFFKELTISNDQLAVNIPKDSVRFFINNQAPVVRSNIKVSNGYIHVIGGVLKPITYTTYNWLEQNPDYLIFKSAVDITGLKNTLDFNKNSSTNGSLFTLLLEPDSIYFKHKIYSLSDLQDSISPNNTDYTNPSNPLYKFVSYHLLTGSKGLSDFVKKNNVNERNYDTYSDIPLRITDLGFFCVINMGSVVFDTIVNGRDTTIINYIGFNYDASNILTLSGSINVIDQVLTPVKPMQTKVDLQFADGEPLLQKMGKVGGTQLIEDASALTTLKWSGADLYYVSQAHWSSFAWNSDYLMVTKGDFTLTYTTPKILPGNYDVLLRADGSSKDNAFIQMDIDGVSIGGVIDLTTGGNWDPFSQRKLGSINFASYEQHVIHIKSLIPGRFLLDVITFDLPK